MIHMEAYQWFIGAAITTMYFRSHFIYALRSTPFTEISKWNLHCRRGTKEFTETEKVVSIFSIATQPQTLFYKISEPFSNYKVDKIL